MVNVLPQKKKRLIRVKYYTNLATLALGLLSVVFFVGGVFLIPSFITSSVQADAYERYRDALSGTIGLKEREQTEKTVSSLVERVRLLKNHIEMDRMVDVIKTVVDKKGTALALFGVSFSRGENTIKIQMNGEANTRADLLAFVDALRADPALVNVTLPVSQLVVERDVPFSLSVEYVPQ